MEASAHSYNSQNQAVYGFISTRVTITAVLEERARKFSIKNKTSGPEVTHIFSPRTSLARNNHMTMHSDSRWKSVFFILNIGYYYYYYLCKLIIYIKGRQLCINLFIFLCTVHCIEHLFLWIATEFSTWTQPTLERLKHQTVLQGSLNKGECWIWSWCFILETSELSSGVSTLGYCNSQFMP